MNLTLSEEKYEIHGMYNHKPFHIVLGDNSYFYSGANHGAYKVKNPESWLCIFENLIDR